MSNRTNETNENINKSFKKPGDIICPECGENALIKIDNYKIKLFGCKNEHIMDNILLNEFFDCQNKGLSKKNYQDNNDNTKTNQKLCNNCNMNLCNESTLQNNKIYCINEILNIDEYINYIKSNNIY